MGCSPWGRKELDMTERLSIHSVLNPYAKDVNLITSVRTDQL